MPQSVMKFSCGASEDNRKTFSSFFKLFGTAAAFGVWDP